MEFDIQGYFEDVWGLHEAFKPKFDGVQGDVSTANQRINWGSFGTPYYATDIRTGREYYLPLQINVGNATIPNLSTTYAARLGELTGDNSGLWNLPFPVVSGNISIQKHIIDTQLTERNGMVSELININAFKVNVKGFLVNDSNEFPENDYTILNTIFNFNIPVTINNVVTDVLLKEYQGSKTVTLRNLKFMQKKGVKHVVPYELDMVGDLPFNLNQIS